MVVLDTAAQEGDIASGTPIDRAGDVKVQLEECTDDFDSIACENARPVLLLLETNLIV